MSSRPRLWSRIRTGRLVQILLVYLGASWLVVQVVGDLRDLLDLPEWLGPVTVIFLAIGLIIMLATAWVQSHPFVDAREERDEVPHSWEFDFGDVVAAIRRGRMPHLTWSRALVGGAVAFSLLIGAAGLFVLVRDGGDRRAASPEAVDEAAPGVAVLPFTTRGGDLADWREGMVDLLSAGLDGAGGLRAIASRTVLARWHEVIGDGEAPEESVALDVARRAGARFALLGSVVAIGPAVRLTVDVHELDASGSRRLGQAQAQGHPDSVLVLVDELGLKTLALMLPAGIGSKVLDIGRVTTASLPAVKRFLEGEALYRRSDFEGAAQEYERAINADTLFALAYWRLSQALGWNENFQSPRAAEANRKALSLGDRLPPREALLARAVMLARNRDVASVTLLQEGVRRYPDDAEVWYQLGDAFYHVPGALVGWEEIEDAFERAVALAPSMAPYHVHLAEGAMRYHADSTIIAQRVAALESLAPDSRQTERFRVAQGLVFGGDAARDSLGNVLMNNLTTGLPGRVASVLSHPRFFEAQVALGVRAYPLVPPGVQKTIARDRGLGLIFGLGRIRQGLDALRDPAVKVSDRAGMILDMHLYGLPLPPGELDRAYASLKPQGEWAMQASAIAAQRGEWDRHRAGIASLARSADSLANAGDSAQAVLLRGRARSLEGYALLQQGSTAEATRILDAARIHTGDELGRWWLAMLHKDAGRFIEAEPYLQSFMKFQFDPLAAYHLAHVYDATGRRDMARSMYARFIEAWSDGDALVQPMVADARTRLASLAGEGGV